MQLTIHRGSHEIGGNCVELQAGSTRIVLDVGMPLVGLDGEPFDQNAALRKTKEELQADGTLPGVPGLFGNGPAPTAILLSHAHSDHSGLLDHTQPEIPIYLSRGTSKMLHAGSIFAGQSGFKREREQIFEPEKPFQIGPFTVTAYPVDHSAFDSVAFLIEGEGKRLLYSGDLRLHGRKPWMAERIMAAVKDRPVDILLMEGTHFSAGRHPGITEQELEVEVLAHLKRAEGLVLTAFSPLHVDRLVTFYRAIRQSGRVFVLDPYAAYVMHLASGQCKIPKPNPEAGIRVCYNAYFEESHERRRIKKIHSMFQGSRIPLQEVLANPKNYAMVFRTSMIDRDFDGTLPEAAQCLYSYWAGYLQRPEWADLRSKLAAVGGDFIEAHTSGHIFADDIVKFVKTVNPKTVIPIHTFKPERFLLEFDNAWLVQDGQAWNIE